MHKPTMMSLFDGSGGFPLAASMCGIVPIAASEVEPYPIAVTRSRFPNMKHLGSITDINGGEVEPVDVITFGSPCQDLSVAGKRAGLKHEDNGDDETTRSGLFMEAVRIIKEMRKATNGLYPRFAIWENVPGAFSSNKGEDFRIVCEELIKIVEPSAVMPAVPKNGWPYADSYCGEGWSLAYRVFDAQYWGVPQRRRRIYLVVDFGGECAGKILFEREGLRGYFTEGGAPWQGAAADAQGCAGADDREGEIADTADSGGEIPMSEGVCRTRADGNGWYDWSVSAGCGGGRDAVGFDGYNVDSTGKVAKTLTAGRNDTHNIPVVAYSFDSLSSNSMKSSNPYSGCRQVEVAKTLDCFDPNPSKNQGGIAIVEAVGVDVYNQAITGDKSKTLNSSATDADHVPCVMEAFGFDRYNQCSTGNVCETLRTPGGGDNYPTVCYAIDNAIPIHDQATRFSGKRGDKTDGKGNGLGVGNPGDPMNTLTGGDRHAVAFQTYQKVTGPLMANTHPGSYTGQDAFSDMLVAGPYQSVIGALCCTDYKWVQQQQVEQDKLIVEQHNIRYIVRRLTPTECARLQGFADRWAVPDRKEDFTDEEYSFWLDVRNTHAEINGKAVKDYTKEQMLTWYNKLHTDSSEYKLWGNGIALPCALYVMQGIADVLNN